MRTYACTVCQEKFTEILDEPVRDTLNWINQHLDHRGRIYQSAITIDDDERDTIAEDIEVLK